MAVTAEDAVSDALAHLAARRPQVLRLAYAASVAAVVEPALLRRLRLELPGMSDVDAGHEQELWVGRVAHVSTATQLSLRPDLANRIRREMAAASLREFAGRARAVVVSAHRRHSGLLRLEEDLVWAYITADTELLEGAFGRALATARQDAHRATVVARWFDHARRRLPAEVLETQPGWALAAVLARGRRVVPEGVIGSPRLPPGLGGPPSSTGQEEETTTVVGVRLVKDGVHFVLTSDPAAAELPVPLTAPLVAEAEWSNPAGTVNSRVLEAEPGSKARLEGLDAEGQGVVFRTVSGARFQMRLQPETQPQHEVPSQPDLVPTPFPYPSPPRPADKAPIFFVSYARPRSERPTGEPSPVLRLYNDLSTHVAELVGAPAGVEPGFLDHASLSPGTAWSRDVLQAVRTAQVFVPLLSPALFSSAWCGQEWDVFSRRRLRSREAEDPDEAPTARTATLLPVIWVPSGAAAVPPVVEAVQHFTPHNVAPSIVQRYETEGLYGLLVNPQLRDDYHTVVWRLAQRIAELHYVFEVEPGEVTPDVGYQNVFQGDRG